MRWTWRLRALRNRTRESPWTLSIVAAILGGALGYALGAQATYATLDEAARFLVERGQPGA